MIVIYEQDYDVVSILDIIEDEEFDSYMIYYKNKILNNKNHKSIEEIKIENDSVNYKVIYNYAGNPIEWLGYQYTKFEKINNYKNEI